MHFKHNNSYYKYLIKFIIIAIIRVYYYSYFKPKVTIELRIRLIL
jgi:hypothetical protein